VSCEARFTIEWCDCDKAGIVFYPTYFYWLDGTFQQWLRTVGLSTSSGAGADRQPRSSRRGRRFGVRPATMTNYAFEQRSPTGWSDTSSTSRTRPWRKNSSDAPSRSV